MALSLEDKWTIMEMVHKFPHYSDYCEWDNLRTLYTADAVQEIDGVPPYSGVEAHVEHADQSAKVTDGKNRHVMTNLYIEPDPDNADGAIAYYYLMNYVPLGLCEYNFVSSGRFHDKFVRTPDGWRIAHRHFIPDIQFDMSILEEA